MPFVKKLEVKLKVVPHNEVAADMPERWAESLSNNAGRLYDRLLAKIPDDATFSKLVAGPSSDAYANFVNPAYRSKSGRSADEIKATKFENMWSAFDRWLQGLANSFGNGAASFKAAVANAKTWWAERVGAKTLRFTGDRIRGRGPAPIAAYLLVGDRRAIDWLSAEDEIDGTPYDIARDGEQPTLKTAIQQKLVQGGVLVSNSGNSEATMLAQNTINASILNGLRDPAKADAFVATYDATKCFCLWRLDIESRLYLHLQVGVTV